MLRAGAPEVQRGANHDQALRWWWVGGRWRQQRRNPQQRRACRPSHHRGLLQSLQASATRGAARPCTQLQDRARSKWLAGWLAARPQQPAHQQREDAGPLPVEGPLLELRLRDGVAQPVEQRRGHRLGGNRLLLQQRQVGGPQAQRAAAAAAAAAAATAAAAAAAAGRAAATAAAAKGAEGGPLLAQAAQQACGGGWTGGGR